MQNVHNVMIRQSAAESTDWKIEKNVASLIYKVKEVGKLARENSRRAYKHDKPLSD